MTYFSAEEPDRPDTTGQTASAEPPGKVEPEAGGQLSEPAAPVLSEKPVLEWTTEDWARWIEDPALLNPPVPEAKAGAGAGTEAEQAEQTPAPVVAEEVRIEGDPTATWSLPVDEDDEDAKWWSAVAGLPKVSAATPAPTAPPAPPDEAVPEPITPPPPAPITPPRFPAPSITPPPPPPAPSITPPPLISPPPPVLPSPLPLTPSSEPPPAPAPAPPVTDPRPSGLGTAARRPQHARTAPEAAAPSRSPQSRRASLEPIDDIAVRVRAGLSLLGVSVLVGAVTAGLITVAIFMASVVLRRALG